MWAAIGAQLAAFYPRPLRLLPFGSMLDLMKAGAHPKSRESRGDPGRRGGAERSQHDCAVGHARTPYAGPHSFAQRLIQDRRSKSGIVRSADRAAIAREAAFVSSPRVIRVISKGQEAIAELPKRCAAALNFRVGGHGWSPPGLQSENCIPLMPALLQACFRF